MIDEHNIAINVSPERRRFDLWQAVSSHSTNKTLSGLKSAPCIMQTQALRDSSAEGKLHGMTLTELSSSMGA